MKQGHCMPGGTGEGATLYQGVRGEGGTLFARGYGVKEGHCIPPPPPIISPLCPLDMSWDLP